MKASGDLVIGRSGDRKSKFTAETQRRGENLQKSTTKAQRHGGESGDRNERNTGLYQDTGFSHTVKGKNTWASAPTLLRRTLQTIRATFREIFDESAYDRFLLRTHASRSVASYRAFTCERDAAIVKKPRCC
jgi:hypothetical protein